MFWAQSAVPLTVLRTSRLTLVNDAISGGSLGICCAYKRVAGVRV